MMPIMRTTVRVDDELLERLKAEARRENVSLTRLFNRVLEAGLQTGAAKRRKHPVYREPPRSLGTPRVSLAKALALAATFEDQETLRKLALRK
jgi:hypothetical protein